MNAWWLGLAPAQASVECGGEEHRLRWEAGELHALDHGDVESERTLAVLGGRRCTCVDLLGAWERHHDDLRVLVLASRGPTDPVVVSDDPGTQPGAGPAMVAGRARVAAAVPGSAFVAVRGRAAATSSMGRAAALPSPWTPYGPTGRASKRAEANNELLALLGLGGGVPERLVATIAAAWRERLAQPDRALTRARPQLRAALHGRVLAAMRAWLGRSGLRSELTMIAETGRPSLVAKDGIAHAELPFGWLVDVWARDLATIWGRFCLSAATYDGRSWTLTTVGPDLGPPSLVTLQLGDAGGT